MSKLKIYKGMTKSAIAAVLLASLATPSIGKAADGDYYSPEGKLHTFADIAFDNNLFNDLAFRLSQYKYELGGKVYNAQEINNLVNQGATVETLAQKVQEAGLKAEEIPSQTLAVSSVMAINSTILPSADVDTTTYKLALNYLDKDGQTIPADKLPADLVVSYTDSKDVFNTDGTIKNKANIPAAGQLITVVATVTSASANLNLTKEFSVGVVNASDWASVTDAKITVGATNAVTKNTLETSDTDVKLVPTVAIQSNGTKLEGATAPTNWSAQVKSVTSSDITVVTASKSSNDIVLTPITAGTATITVELNSGTKFEKVITVKEGAREAAKITAAQEKVTLSSTLLSSQVKVTVTDQYGDPVKDATVYAHPAKTGSSAIVSNPASVTTDAKGEATLTLTAASTATTGTDTITLSTNADATKAGLGTLNVEYAKAGTVSAYELRIASDSTSADASIDVYDTKDNSLKLEFVGKDSAGVVAAIYNQTTVGTTYTASSSDAAVATVAVDAAGKITVSPVKAGTATVTVKEGNIVRATLQVTVTDSTPVVGSIALKEGAQLSVDASTAKTLTTDDVKALLSVTNGDKVFDLAVNGTSIEVKDGANVIANIQLFSSNSEKLLVQDVTVTPQSATEADTGLQVIAKLVQGEKTVGTTTIPVVVDTTVPTATATTTNVGKAAAKLNATTNTGLVLTAKNAGVDGNNISLTIAAGTDATASANQEIQVAVANSTEITVTLGAKWDDSLNSGSGGSVKSSLSEIVNAINGNTAASALVTASLASTEQATVAGKAETKANLAGGTNELTVAINFSEAVKGVQDGDLTATSGTYTYKHDGAADSTLQPTVTVSEDKKTVTLVYSVTDAAKKLVSGTSKLVIADSKITDLAGNSLAVSTELTLTSN